jgi:hypothetical protein
VMKPKPFASLNHFTVPVDESLPIATFLLTIKVTVYRGKTPYFASDQER